MKTTGTRPCSAPFGLDAATVTPAVPGAPVLFVVVVVAAAEVLPARSVSETDVVSTPSSRLETSTMIVR